jgi:hypothetical protein
MTRFSLSALACSALLAVSAAPLAAVGVGDKPEFEFPIYNSEETLTNLDVRGRWTVVLFWSSNGSESVAALGAVTMMADPTFAAAQANLVASLLAAQGVSPEEAARVGNWSEGLELCAICVDGARRDRNVRRAVEQANFSGRLVYDREETGQQIASDWGIDSVPTIFFIAPNGEVAVVSTEDDDDEGASQTFERIWQLATRYPPLTEADKERAEQQLTAAESAVDAGDELAALDALAGFPSHAAEYFDELGERYRDLSAQLNPLGERELERVRRMVERGETDQARVELADLIDTYEALPVGRTFRDELKRLAHPPVRARQQAGQAMQGRVARLVARAEQLIASGRRVDAHRKLSFIVERFPHTKASDRARETLEALASDESFKREQRAERTRRVCERLLAEADALVADNDLAGARAKWRQILEQYGDSDFATTAQDKLDEHR